MNLSLDDLRGLTYGKLGVVDVACPECGPHCRGTVNQRRKVLRVWDDGEFVTYKCARCDIHGWAKDEQSNIVRPAPREKPPEPDKAKLAAYLWSQAQPITESPAENYLHSRQCFIHSEALRYLPARGKHPPAMIARFGEALAVTGVHMTKLMEDGSGKAGTESDKIMIGPSLGQPIIVYDNPDRDELLIAEGIEDAGSLALATGWTAWAAGSAARIPHLIANVALLAPHLRTLYVAFDHDPPIPVRDTEDRIVGHRPGAATRAYEKVMTLRPDVIPLRIAKALGLRERIDANKALISFGQDVLRGTVEWSQAQQEFATGKIGFHALQNRVDGIAAFRGLLEKVLSR